MNREKLVENIYGQQKETNKHLQKLYNIALLGLLFKFMKDAQKKNDKAAIKMCKVGLIITIIADVVLLIEDFLDIFVKKDVADEE